MGETKRRVIALGFFDGVHLGHGALLRRVAERARELDAVPCAFTFDQHPSARLTGQSVPLLSSLEDRVWLMRRNYGIEEVLLGSFDAMMKMSWRDFVTEYLAREHGAVHVVAGHDFHFGYRGEGNPERLRALCAERGIGCDIIGRVELDGVTVSSTHIRPLVQAGEMEEAARFLGHPHLFGQRVGHGKRLGRTLGFPTVNLPFPEGLLVPAYGVYATLALLEDGRAIPAVTNVGVRPTVEQAGRANAEGYLLDFDGDLYGQEVRLAFYHRLRGERKFPSVEALRAEVLRNADQTRDYFAARKEERHAGPL